MTAADLCVNSTTGIENKRERPLLVVQSQQAPPSVCPELDVRGSSNQAAGQLTVVTGNNVPQADDDFPDLPARYPTLNVPFDVCGALAHLAS